MLNYWTIYFESDKNIKNEIENARILHAVFFKILSNFDETIADEYHNRSDRQRFTMSTIFHESNKNYAEFRKGEILKFNISAYDSRVAKILNKFLKDESIANLKDKERSFIIFNENKFYLKAVKCDIVDEEFLEGKYKKKYEIKFLTPTMFRVNPCNYPLPDPKKIFKSLNKTYFEIFNKVILSDEEIEEIPRYIALENVFIKSQMATYRQYSFLGFVGNITISSKHKNEELKKRISILANLIPFVGIGYKSGMGMGKCILL